MTPADIQAQFDRALEEIVPTSDARGVTLTPESKQQALQTILQQRCPDAAEFMIAMERNAHLRKLVEADFTVDEATLREEFRAALRREGTSAAHPGRGRRFAGVEQPRSTQPRSRFRRGRAVSINQDTAARGDDGTFHVHRHGDPAALRVTPSHSVGRYQPLCKPVNTFTFSS